jgi:pantoate--beta-alanine ligase
MKIIETREALNAALRPYRNNADIGFVPTMGALHAGHISLAERSLKENAGTVVSIFVNPTQFNNRNDLINYPRTLSADIKCLESAGCDFLFVPSEHEMYPEADARVFDFGQLDKVMEGAYRPGHFTGVAQVVSKLFDMVQPAKAYFGEKDFQQLTIIRHITKMMGYPIQITGCPVVREADGLAMSSRNVRLTPQQRQNAPAIAKTLFESREKITSMPVDRLKKWVVAQIDSNPELQTEYFDIVDRDTLQSAARYEPHALQGCIAVYAGSVRLIDNIPY